MPLQIEADPNGAVTTLFPDAKYERHDFGWNTKLDLVWSPRQVPETGYPVLLIALFPDVKERRRYSEKPAGLADVAADALRMLQHAQRGFYLPCLVLLVSWIPSRTSCGEL